MTPTSIWKRFSEFFGFSNDYVARRFYTVLCGPKKKTLTKPVFLKAIFPLVMGSDVSRWEFGFAMYDTNQDGSVSANEVSDMYFELP